jgi:hypothetical protein
LGQRFVRLGFESFTQNMGNKNHKKTIRSLTQRILEHQEKIRLEYEKSNSNRGLIKHWEKEIRAFEKGIQQALKRLGE